VISDAAVVELDPREHFGLIKQLQEMERLVLVGAKDPFIVKNAMRIVSAFEPRIARKAYLQEIAALLQYAQGIHPTLGGLRYQRDPYEVTSIPSYVEEKGGGDAAELAVWLAAHLLAIGHGPLRFVVISDSSSRRPDDFVHVYLHYGNPESDRVRWFALDPTQEKPMGWEYPNPGKKAYYEIGAEEDEG